LLVAVGLSLLVAVASPQRATLAVNLGLDNCLLMFIALVVRRRDVRSHAVRSVARVDATASEFEVDPSFEVERPLEIDRRAPRPVYSAGVPVIAAPVVGALSASIASTG
jgi:hypothetical protein